MVTDHPTTSSWAPGAPGADSTTELRRLLAAEGRPFVGPAAVELGRGLAPMIEVDVLLGASPVVAGLARHAEPGDRVVVPTPRGLRAALVVEVEPVP